ncbi:MAG: PIG-L family deacetylase [Chloroflexota bacterium]|nr:PIG-L family deacetylase [Chloroflexota bacterium]
MPAPLTLMTVHARPDDEAIGTGGVLARYADEGIGTVLVTCTGGEVGEIGDPTRATPENLADVRERELRAACAILGVRHLELLGYRDSGMLGTPDNEHPDAFGRAYLDVAAGRLVALIRRYRPQVLVNYDDTGFYGHPDHVNANRITVRAFARTGDPGGYPEHGLAPWQPSKLYYTAVPRSQMAEFGRRLAKHRIRPPLHADAPEPSGANDSEARGDAAQAVSDMPAPEGAPPIGTPDELVTTYVDVSRWVERKRRALWAHATQMGPETFFARMPPTLFDELFGTELFQLVESRVTATSPEDDLFAGLRGGAR